MNSFLSIFQIRKKYSFFHVVHSCYQADLTRGRDHQMTTGGTKNSVDSVPIWMIFGSVVLDAAVKWPFRSLDKPAYLILYALPVGKNHLCTLYTPLPCSQHFVSETRRDGHKQDHLVARTRLKLIGSCVFFFGGCAVNQSAMTMQNHRLLTSAFRQNNGLLRVLILACSEKLVLLIVS